MTHLLQRSVDSFSPDFAQQFVCLIGSNYSHAYNERDCRLLRESRSLRAELQERAQGSFGRLVGESPAMKSVLEMLERVRDTPATVLLVGESGTGKGVAARALHDLGVRRDREFISVNCGAIPETLIEAFSPKAMPLGLMSQSEAPGIVEPNWPFIVENDPPVTRAITLSIGVMDEDVNVAVSPEYTLKVKKL